MIHITVQETDFFSSDAISTSMRLKTDSKGEEHMVEVKGEAQMPAVSVAEIEVPHDHIKIQCKTRE